MSKRKVVPRVDSPARRPAPDSRPLLERILDVPQLAHVVPRLQPDVLHRLIERCGLEDCGELVALATPGQLARVFDLDLWRAAQPGLDEQFDAGRFGVWLEVLVESGASVAAQTLADMDASLVITALAQHALVFDCAAVAAPASEDGEEVRAARSVHDGLGCEVGGYLVLAKGTESWDAIAAVLAALEAEHHDCFQRLMRGCRSLSNSAPEIDGLDDLLLDREQVVFDLAFARERRREQQGYVTPAQARAFLQTSRQLPLGHGSAPPGDPVAKAYFRALEWTPAEDAAGESRRLPASDAAPSPDDTAAAVAAVVDVLVDAGVLAPPPRALLNGAQGAAPRLARIQAQLQVAHDRDPAAYASRSQELAYLANTVLAGCSIQARPFSVQEASDAAVAICNLGLENWPRHWLAAKALPDDFLVAQDLVSVFQVGWKVLYEDVCLDTAERLIGVLTGLRCADREIQASLKQLRLELRKQWQAGAPWRARDALDVIAILDMPAWAALLGLMDECPVMHAGVGASRSSRTHAVSASAFEFIADNSQIASIREFMQSLPETLRG
jgi:Family of unknown function (DUF6178)